jgi:hypothetical protein
VKRVVKSGDCKIGGSSWASEAAPASREPVIRKRRFLSSGSRPLGNSASFLAAPDNFAFHEYWGILLFRAHDVKRLSFDSLAFTA